MKNHHIFFLILLQSIQIFSCSNIELYQDFIANYTEQAHQAEKRLSELRLCKEERALEIPILKLHPQSPYKDLIPQQSYATLNVSRYATDNEIASSLSKLQKIPNAQLDQLDKAYENICKHRNVKKLYIKLMNELKKIPFSKENFIESEHSINKYAHVSKHINQDDVVTDFIKNRALQHLVKELPYVINRAQNIKKINDEITQDIKDLTYEITKTFVICGLGIIIIPTYLASFQIDHESFDI